MVPTTKEMHGGPFLALGYDSMARFYHASGVGLCV